VRGRDLAGGCVAGLCLSLGLGLGGIFWWPAAAGAQQASPLDAVGRLLSDGKPQQAEAAARQLLASGDHAAARDLLGIALSQQGRIEEARAEFERAVRLAPDSASAQQHLARTLLQLDRPDGARDVLRTAAKLGPLERDLAFELAAMEAARGNPEAAEAQLLSVTERFASVRALLDLARLEARRGANSEAFAHLGRALEVAPNSEDVLSAYARVALAIKSPVTAIRTLERLTRMYPAAADYPYLLGVAKFRIAENAGAVEALERALELEPQNGRAAIALGLTFNSQRRFAEAKEALLGSLQLLPGNVDALVALGEAEAGLDELEAAERSVLRALELAPEAPEALYVLGKIRMTQGRYAEARDVLLESAERDPRSSKTHYQLSLAYARLGDRERSAESLERYRSAVREEQERLGDLLREAGVGVSGMGGVGG
jgi:tetratricopeptide (TPR) repeat protein